MVYGARFPGQVSGGRFLVAGFTRSVLRVFGVSGSRVSKGRFEGSRFIKVVSYRVPSGFQVAVSRWRLLRVWGFRGFHRGFPVGAEVAGAGFRAGFRVDEVFAGAWLFRKPIEGAFRGFFRVVLRFLRARFEVFLRAGRTKWSR